MKILQCINNMKINHDSMADSRFITHLQFFARRIILNTPLDDYDEEINDFIAYKYPNSYACAAAVIATALGFVITWFMGFKED